MPNVLMIGPNPDAMGGMATVERQLTERLSGTDVKVRFISTYEDCSKAKKAAIAFGAYTEFRRALKRADIVHVHMASRGSYERKSLFLKKATSEGRKTIIHLHGGEFAMWFDDELGDKKRDEIRSTFNSADAVIVLSEEWEEWLISRDFVPKRLVVMHNSVPVPEKPCNPCSHQNVLFLGRLDARKSPDVLLRASRKMLAEHLDAKLLFGGDGYPERYEALACELGIADRCEFLGWITGDNKEKLFARAGIYCLPSKNEGMPMSVLEAMARGIPTIATSVGGVPQVVQNEKNGFLICVDDEEELECILCNLMDDLKLRKRIGMSGRETIINNFNINRNIEELLSLYEEVLS